MRGARWVVCAGGLVLVVASAPAAAVAEARQLHAASVPVAHPDDADAFVLVPALDEDRAGGVDETADAVAAADASAVDPSAGGGTPGGGSAGGRTPGMVGGTFPGNVWAVADAGEVRAAVNAFRASRGLPALGVPFDSCADRGVVISPAFGIPAGTTHGRLIVAQQGGTLTATPREGGIMTADVWTSDITDIDGVLRPRAMAGVRLYECAMSGTAATSPGNYNPQNPSPPASPQPSQPPPAPPSPSPSPSAPPPPAPSAPPAESPAPSASAPPAG